MRLLGRGGVAGVARAHRQPAKAQAAQDIAEAALGQMHAKANLDPPLGEQLHSGQQAILGDELEFA